MGFRRGKHMQFTQYDSEWGKKIVINKISFLLAISRSIKLAGSVFSRSIVCNFDSSDAIGYFGLPRLHFYMCSYYSGR